MPRISHVVWDKFDLDYGYMFDIQNVEELTDYWRDCRAGQVKRGVADFIKAEIEGKGHISTPYASYLYATQFKYEGASVLEMVSKSEAALIDKMIQTVREKGRIFINATGGYFFMIEGMSVKHTTEVKKYVVPNGKITITKWPGGEHFYARVDGEDVELYGRRKWDSHKEAMSAALKFQQEANS
jgi:hypothetical protein